MTKGELKENAKTQGSMEKYGIDHDKVWKTFGKSMGKVWKTFGKSMEKVWNIPYFETSSIFKCPVQVLGFPVV